MEFLKDTENFGVTYKKGDDLEKFLADFVAFTERRIFNRLSKRVNFLLKRVNGQKIEFIADGNDDVDQNGNWQIIISDDDLPQQRRESGIWVNKWTTEADGT